MKKFASIAALAAAGLASNAFGTAVTVSTVSAYDPNPNNLTIGNATATGATNIAQQINLATFQTSIAAAFLANTGGTVNFETAQGWGTSVNDVPKYGTSSADPVSATYGTNQSSTFQYYRNDGPTAATPPVATGMTSAAGDTNSVVASGTQYLGFTNLDTIYTINFVNPLSALGLTQIPRNAARALTMTATLSDTTTIVLTGSTNAAPGATFYGFLPTGGNTITKLVINSPNSYARFDDLGFIVAPVAAPEPASLGLLALGGVGLLRRRRA